MGRSPRVPVEPAGVIGFSAQGNGPRGAWQYETDTRGPSISTVYTAGFSIGYQSQCHAGLGLWLSRIGCQEPGYWGLFPMPTIVSR